MINTIYSACKMTNSSERLDYLDLLKGFAIFLVVMGHFLAWTFPADVDRGFYPLFVKNVIYSFHMPLFFFVSGYLVDLKRKEWKIGTGMTVIWKRVQTLLLPGFSFLLILYVRTGAVYFEWFLKVLFEMYLAYVVTRLVSRYLFNKVSVEMVLHVGAVVAIFLVKRLSTGTSVNDLLSFSAFCNFYPYFLLGYVCCRFKMEKLVASKDWIYSLCVVAWCVLFLVMRETEFPGKKYIVAISAIVVCFKIAQSVDFSKPTLVTRSLIRWGKISLAIYLISPMIIPWFPELGMYFIKADAYERFGSFTHATHLTSIFCQVVSGVVISLYVCVICSLLKKIFEKSKVLNFILFGQKSE